MTRQILLKKRPVRYASSEFDDFFEKQGGLECDDGMKIILRIVSHAKQLKEKGQFEHTKSCIAFMKS